MVKLKLFINIKRSLIMEFTKRVCVCWHQDPGPPENKEFFTPLWDLALDMHKKQETDFFSIISSDRLTRWRFFINDDTANRWVNFYTDLVNQADQNIKEKFDRIFIEDNDSNFLEEADQNGYWKLTDPNTLYKYDTIRQGSEAVKQ